MQYKVSLTTSASYCSFTRRKRDQYHEHLNPFIKDKKTVHDFSLQHCCNTVVPVLNCCSYKLPEEIQLYFPETFSYVQPLFSCFYQFSYVQPLCFHGSTTVFTCTNTVFICTTIMFLYVPSSCFRMHYHYVFML